MKRFFVLALFGALLTAPLAAQNDLQPVAIVRLTRSEPITVKQLRTEVEKMEQQAGRTLTVAERRQVLDVMINERLCIQAADRDRVTVSDSELNQQIQQMKNQMAQALGRQPTEPEFATEVRNQTGLDIAAFREQIRRQFIVQKYLQTKKGAILEGVRAPTEAEILSNYNLNKSQYIRPETVRFSMIQVPFTNEGEKTQARTLANRLAQEIGSNPTKFDEAVSRSQAPNSNLGYMGGDGGYLPRNPQALQLVGQAFLDTAFSLRQGEISRVVESAQGFHIIKITETYEMKALALDDLVQLGTQITVREYIRQGIGQQRQQEALARASQELVTELRVGNPFQIFENYLNW